MNKIIILLGILGTFVFGNLALNTEAIPIRNETLSKNFLMHNVTVIDIRTEDEYKKTGILPGSHILSFYEEESFVERLASLVDKEESIAILSQDGEHSLKVAWLLNSKGYKHITNLVGGVEQGIKNGIELR